MNAELIQQLTEYADNPGYSHGDYADTMRQAAKALAEVAAVRAVPEDRAAKLAAAFAIVKQDYSHKCLQMATTPEYVINAISQLIDAGYAAPSPQPELSDCIDTPEFRQKIATLVDATHGAFLNAIDELVAHIDAWKDAACAAAVENAQAEVATWKRYAEGVEKRATDAEAKLAAIRKGADIRVKYADYFATIERAQDCLRKLAEFKLSEPVTQPQAQEPVKLMTMQEVIDAMRDKELLTDLGYSALLNGDYIHATLEYITQIINYVALAQRTSTPSQSDTSGLAG